jgi:hypothetical protein
MRTSEDVIGTTRRILDDPTSCYDADMIARFRDFLSYDSNRLGTEQMLTAIEEFGGAHGGWDAVLNGLSAWRPMLGYRWHQSDKNVRGELFPPIDLNAVAARLEQFRCLLGLDGQLKVQACGTKVLLVSPCALPISTRIRRAVGRW